MPLTRDAGAVWRALNGVICVYKPLNYSSNKIRSSIIVNICRDLNQLDPREPTPHILIEPRGSSETITSETKLSIQVTPSLVDHVNVTGPRFIPKDVKCRWNKHFGLNTTGVFLLGINKGVINIHHMVQDRTMRTMQICGRLGRATDTGWDHIGKSIMKANYKHVPREALDRILAATQAAHQRQAYEFARIDPQSQQAFEIAKGTGIIKPEGSSGTLLYQARCTKFEPPDFTIEVQCINESEHFLVDLVSEVGRRVRSVASCVSIRCVRDGPFTVDHALSRTQWSLDHIVANMRLCAQVLSENKENRRKIEAV